MDKMFDIPGAGPGHPDPILSGELGERAASTIRVILRTLLVLLPVLMVPIYLDSRLSETLALAGLLAAVIVLYALLQKGRLAATIYGLVLALILHGIAAVVSHGSVRSIGTLSFIAAVVIGGIFLGRNALVATVTAIATALAALTWAQMAGWLVEPSYDVGLMHWVIHAATVAAIALNVYYARTLVVESLLRARASEERFANAFRLSPIGMTISRLSDGTILEVNDTDHATLGYAREEVIGRRSTETGAWLTAADRQRFLARLQAEGTVSAYETRMRNRAGELVDCMLWATRMDINGEPCVLAAVVNVSEKKREEALILEVARGVSGQTGEPFFRTLVEHLARAVNADRSVVGEIVDGDRVRTLALLRHGAPSPNVEYALAGTPSDTLSRAPGLTVYEDRVAELFPADAPLAVGNMRGYAGVSLRDADGTPIGVLNVISRAPIVRTERLEALFRIFAARAQAELLRMRRDRQIEALNESLEQRVAERTAQLEAANRELEAFSYSVSHDLRAPLRSIDGFVRILAGEQGQVDETLRARAQARVLAATARMNALIEDLIGLARVSRSELHAEDVDLSGLAREVGEQQRERHPAHPVEFHVPDGLAARCDRALMRIVLENLLGNAWKFTARREGARVEFGSERQPGGETAYFVRDNGAGFEPEYAHRLFAPFQRLHSEAEFEGTGIGLATVQRIVALHGGRVWAAGAPGRGATVYFACGTG